MSVAESWARGISPSCGSWPGLSVSPSFLPEFLCRGLPEGLEAGAAVAGETGVLDEEDIDQAAIPIDRHVGGIDTSVAERASARCPAQAVTILDMIRGLFAGQLVHRGPGQIAFALEDAAVVDHLTEPHQVVGRREEAARGHGLARAVAERVLEVGDDRLLQSAPVLGWFVRFREAGELLGAGPEGCVVHTQRPQQPRFQKILVGHAALDLDDPARGIDAGVRVLILASRLEQER